MPAKWFVGMACATAGCWGSGNVRAPAEQPRLEAAPPDLSGQYWCSIDSDGYDYPRYACVIKKVGGRFVFAKLGGSQRLRGVVVPDQREGFKFTGELYCPLGACSMKLHGDFAPTGHGELRGTFSEDAMVMRLTPAPAGAFGGANYGDGGDGDPFGYGGAGAPDGR